MHNHFMYGLQKPFSRQLISYIACIITCIYLFKGISSNLLEGLFGHIFSDPYIIFQNKDYYPLNIF